MGNPEKSYNLNLTEDEMQILSGCSNYEDFERIMIKLYPGMDSKEISLSFQPDFVNKGSFGRVIRVLKGGCRNFVDFINVMTMLNPDMTIQELKEKFDSTNDLLNDVNRRRIHKNRAKIVGV